MDARRAIVVCCCLALLAVPVLAHEPAFAGENTDPDRAYRIDDPSKSWAIYDSLGRDQVRYYEVTLEPGERLYVSLYTPESGGFTPSLVLLHDGFESVSGVPSWVTVPDGMGGEVVRGTRPGHAEYEPFTPGSYYYTVQVDRQVETGGTYLLAVYDPDRRAGPVGVAVGYEERFSAAGYLGIPFRLLSIHLWEGQHPLVVFAPLLAVLAGGLVRLRDRGGLSVERLASIRGVLLLSALIVGGTAAITGVQTILALSRSGPTASAGVTAAFVAIPAVGAWWLWRRATGADFSLTPRTRVGLVFVGASALVTWAGLVVAPAAVLLVAVLPAGVREKLG